MNTAASKTTPVQENFSDVKLSLKLILPSVRGNYLFEAIATTDKGEKKYFDISFLPARNPDYYASIRKTSIKKTDPEIIAFGERLKDLYQEINDFKWLMKKTPIESVLDIIKRLAVLDYEHHLSKDLAGPLLSKIKSLFMENQDLLTLSKSKDGKPAKRKSWGTGLADMGRVFIYARNQNVKGKEDFRFDQLNIQYHKANVLSVGVYRFNVFGVQNGKLRHYSVNFLPKAPHLYGCLYMQPNADYVNQPKIKELVDDIEMYYNIKFGAWENKIKMSPMLRNIVCAYLGKPGEVTPPPEIIAEIKTHIKHLFDAENSIESGNSAYYSRMRRYTLNVNAVGLVTAYYKGFLPEEAYAQYGIGVTERPVTSPTS